MKQYIHPTDPDCRCNEQASGGSISDGVHLPNCKSNEQASRNSPDHGAHPTRLTPIPGAAKMPEAKGQPSSRPAAREPPRSGDHGTLRPPDRQV